MNKNTEISDGGFECKDISGRMYLWKPKNLTKTPNRLIISAHGHRKTTNTFEIQQSVTLNFYSTDKNSVNDPGLKKIYEGKSTPLETLRKNNHCFNYILSKYTNSQKNTSHNKNNESYQSVNDIMETDYQQSGIQALNDITTALSSGMINETAYEFARKNAMKSIALRPAAILTIRNKRMKADINLKWVLNELSSKGYNFSIIDCLFCRNTLWTGLVGSLPFGGSYADNVPVS